MLGAHVRLGCPVGFAADDARARTAAADRRAATVAQSHRPADAVARRRRGPHRHVGVDGPGGGEGTAPASSSRATWSTPTMMALAAAGGDLHALPARLPWRRGVRRRDRRAAVGRVPTGSQPDARGPRRARLPPRGSTMTTKVQRQSTISRLIGDHEVTNQPQLIAAARRARASRRRRRRCRAISTTSVRSRCGCRAGTPSTRSPSSRPIASRPVDQLRRVMGEWVAEVAWSGNIVILRTPPGCAHVVALGARPQPDRRPARHGGRRRHADVRVGRRRRIGARRNSSRAGRR